MPLFFMITFHKIMMHSNGILGFLAISVGYILGIADLMLLGLVNFVAVYCSYLYLKLF